MAQASGVVSPLAKRILVTLALLIVARLGGFIPIPGLDAAGLFAGPGGGSVIDPNRISVFALGLSNVLLVLVWCEAIGLFLLPLARWQARSPENRGTVVTGLILIALIITVLQASAVADALEAVTGAVPQPGLFFRIGVVSSMVGATVVLLWLAREISRQGIGPGFWLVYLSPYIAALPRQGALIVELVRQGVLAQGLAVSSVVWILVVAVVTIFVAKADFGAEHMHSDPPAVGLGAIFLHRPTALEIAPYFAASAIGHVAIVCAIAEFHLDPMAGLVRIANLVCLAFLILLLYGLRARADLAIAADRGKAMDAMATYRAAFFIAAAFTVISVVTDVFFPFLPGATIMVALVLVGARCLETVLARP